MSFNLQQLTEGIRQRHVGTQNKRLVEKWNRTGLLRGLDDVARENMSTLLENQAAQVLREANTLGSDGSSDIRGFTNIAFPIVRRVFGGLVANELVSIQPMSLPSGLLFYLDYTYGSSSSPSLGGSSYVTGSSIYNSPVGKGVQSGSLGTGGQYDLAGSGFSRVHATATETANGVNLDPISGHLKADGTFEDDVAIDVSSQHDLKALQFDPQLIDRIKPVADGGLGESYQIVDFTIRGGATQELPGVDLTAIKDISLITTAKGTNPDAHLENDGVPAAVQSGVRVHNVRRLNQLGSGTGKDFVPNPMLKLSDSPTVRMIVRADAGNLDVAGELGKLSIDYVKSDTFEADAAGGDTLTVPSFESNMGLGSAQAPVIPEIDIKIESIPVTAQTRKLRARWSPELAQDLNAYHSMDAEVELTQILSEQIALEIDREILNDLLTQAQGANYYWSRSPGKFVNKPTGAEIARTSTLTPGPAFTGTVREWYETLTETVIDVANEIHRKTLRGSANFIVVSPDVATILEASVLYRPAYSLDGDGQVGAPFTMGAEKIGTLSNRFTVYKDPYFPRNKILVGYKGGSYLETGFVYAPYVPLIVTPTIFAPEDFTPRKGVMTRYGKKMVRADFYGTVTCLDMNVI